MPAQICKPAASGKEIGCQVRAFLEVIVRLLPGQIGLPRLVAFS